MELLAAINRILPALGEHPVTSLNVKHPTLAIILPAIAGKIDDLTMIGWWFNRFDTTLYPDSEGAIALPVDTLSFIPDNGDAVARGLKLFNTTTQTYLWTDAVTGSIIMRVPFEQLPESVASWIFHAAIVEAYVTDIGMADEVRMWREEAASAQGRVEREHLRNKRYSTQRSPRYYRLRAAMRS
jgi:hypothetical protein